MSDFDVSRIKMINDETRLVRTEKNHTDRDARLPSAQTIHITATRNLYIE